MRRLGWFIKVLLTVIGKLNFYRKFFAIYLPLNISTPPRSEGPPSPFYPFGTLFSNLALEPCIGFEPKNPSITKKTLYLVILGCAIYYIGYYNSGDKGN